MEFICLRRFLNYKITNECQLPIHPYLRAAHPSREKIHIWPFRRSIIRGPPPPPATRPAHRRSGNNAAGRALFARETRLSAERVAATGKSVFRKRPRRSRWRWRGDRERERRRGYVFLSGVCIGGSEPEKWSAEMAIYDALHNTNYLAGATLKGPLDSRRKRGRRGSGDCREESETVTYEEGQTRCSQRRSTPRRMQPRLRCSVPRGFSTIRPQMSPSRPPPPPPSPRQPARTGAPCSTWARVF